MNIITDALAIIIDPDRQTFQVSSRRNPEYFMTLQNPIVSYSDETRHEVSMHFSDQELAGVPKELRCWGRVEEFKFQNQVEGEIGLGVEYRVSQEMPLLGIRLSVHNLHHQPVRIQTISLCSASTLSTSEEGALGQDTGCYVNGWQSWSFSGAYSAKDKPVLSRLKKFQGPKLYDAATPQTDKAGVFASDQFGVIVDRSNRVGVFAGFLSQKNNFGHVLMQPGKNIPLRVVAAGDHAELPAGQTHFTDWMVLQFVDLNDPDPLKLYMDLTGMENEVILDKDQPSGWCSWYHYFTRISPVILRENLERLTKVKNELPINLVQIDDGYQKSVGDWLETKPFFSGQMDLLAREIREQGFQAGLWLAPFIVHPASSIWKEHPDWLIRDSKGKPVNAGWNWNRFCGGLDLTHPDVQAYLKKVFHTLVEEWGYTYLKLDFLYAGALDGVHHDPSLNRAQILRRGMELIRETVGPSTYLLGCGAPLGSMIGLVDGMRIGTDVAPDWEPRYFGIELLFPNEPDIPSAKNAMQNVLTRSMMHNRWWQNDPDCLLIRESSHLTLTEIQSMASLIAMSGGLLLLSDDMHAVSRYRMRIAQTLLPVIGKRPFVLDWADELHPHLTRLDLENCTGAWHLLGYTNWENRFVRRSLHLSDFRLPSTGRWILRSFWKEKVLMSEGGSFDVNVPPHGTVLLAAREFIPDQAVYAGSNLHISQGLEITDWECNPGKLQMEIRLPTRLEGYFECCLPFIPAKAQGNGKPILFEAVCPGHYKFHVESAQATAIQISS